MSQDFTATINADTKRGGEWQQVLGDTTMFLESPVAQAAVLPDVGEAYVYKLDIALLSDEQRQRLVAHLARKFRLEEAFVDEQIDAVGVPVLAADVTVTIHDARLLV